MRDWSASFKTTHYLLEAAPDVAPSTSDEKLKAALSYRSGFVKAALKAGITGAYAEIGARNTAFLERVTRHGKKVLAGFGISDRRQVETPPRARLRRRLRVREGDR